MPAVDRSTLPRLGIIACDRVWEPLRSIHGDYADLYARLLRDAGAKFELREYAAHAGELPASPLDCDAWLISGSRASVFEPRPWIAEAASFVRAAFDERVPQLGICFGHQLLAQALGGRTERAAGWGLGVAEVRLLPAAGNALPSRLRLHVAHQDQVVLLPPGAERLAAAAHCPNLMFRLGDHVLGVQPHPEFSSALMRDITLDPSLALADAVRAKALASLEQPTDSELVGPWLAEFLRLRV